MYLIPILYQASETAFNTNGIGRLRDCISCIVTEERNGKYECELQYPITGKWYSQIESGMIVLATHDDGKIPQPFRIYRRSAPIDGIVTFNARHISYDLNNIILNAFDASGVVAAMLGIETNSINVNPFEFWTDKTTSANFSMKNPSSVRGILGGSKGSILDVYGGEYEFDKFTVKLHAARGVNSGATIRYGKNLVDIEQTVNVESAYDSVVPFWYQDGTLVVLDERIVASDTSARPVTLDLTSEFQEAPTQAQLRARAKSYLNNNKPWIPNENIKVDFVQLWQTSEYKDVAALQRVNLCDTVNVFYSQLGVTAEKIKVIKTVYNVLLDRYDEMELGEARSTFAQTILKQTSEQLDAIRQEMINSSMMQAAIDHATELITGGLGGHVVFTLNAEGKPEEILIMDTDDVLTAVNVWRFNKNGLGHSHNGYEGPFNDIALTADGKINATMITTGILNAALVKAGILSDSVGLNFWNMETGEFQLASTATIGGKTVATIASDAVDAQTQQSIFNKLTNNGQTQGIYLKNGKLYINATYIDTGTLSATLIKGGTLKLGGASNGNGILEIYDASGNKVGTINNAGAAITGDMTIQKTISSIVYKTLMSTVTARYWDTTFTRGGLKVSATSGSNEGSIVLTATPNKGASTSGKGNINFIHSNRPLMISADDQAHSGRWSSVDIVDGKVALKAGDNSNAYNGIEVLYDSDYHVDTYVGWVGRLFLGGNIICTLSNTSSDSPNMVNNNGKIYRSTSSSKRYKKYITEKIPADMNPAKLYDLPVKTYKYREGYLPETDRKYDKTMLGFIAEDMDEIYPAACQYDQEGQPEMWNSLIMIPAMLKLIQEQKTKNDELETRITRLEALMKG